MKTLYAALILTLGLSVSALAGQSVPRNSLGGEPAPNYAGVSTCEITSSTGTAALLCTSGEGIILDIVASSVATTDALVIRDSATANTTSTVLYSIDKNSLDKAQRIFPRFKNGLSVNALVAPTAPGSASRPDWVIVYTKDVK